MYDSRNPIHRQRVTEVMAICKSKKPTAFLVEAKEILNKEFQEMSSDDAWQKRAAAIRRGRFDSLELATPIVVATQMPETETTIGTIQDVKAIIISLIKVGATMEKLVAKTKMSKYEILGIIKEIGDEGIYEIQEHGTNGEKIYRLEKNISPVIKQQVYYHEVGETNSLTFMAISDSHMGSVYEQPSFIHYLYDVCVERGIKHVFHSGDLTQGWKKNRDNPNELHAITFDDQLEYTMKVWPKRDDITTYFITGNHDHFHVENGGANIGKALALARPDMKYLGPDEADMLFGQCVIRLFHPIDGSSYANSYASQKHIDALPGGDKPHILLMGHHHKMLYHVYRNIHVFEVPSTHKQSRWERGKRISNVTGAWIITVYFDEEGTITRLVPESIVQYKFIKDDWKYWKQKDADGSVE